MFVTFDGVESPNSIDEQEVRWLGEQLLLGTPSDSPVQAAWKVQRAYEESGHVDLSEDELRAVLTVLAEASQPLSGHRTTERLRWLEQNIRRRLGDLDAH